MFGKAKKGGEFTKRKFFKLKDGDQAFRILPPMGNLADKGVWSRFYNIHYGYKNSKDQMRVFQSSLVKNRKTKMVEVPDAALEKIQKGKAALEAAKQAGNTKLVEQLDKLFGQKGQFNLDNNHYVNAIDEQGNIGLLKLRHRAKLALETTLKALEAEGVDALDAQDGRFLIFRRSGSGLDTSFQVLVKKEKINVPGVGVVEKDISHTITAELAAQMLEKRPDGSYLYKEAADLDNLFKAPTAEEIARIVAEGARAVDEILDAKADGVVASDEPEEEFEEETAAPAASAPVQAAPVAAPVQAAPAPVAQAVAPTPVAAPVAAPVTTPVAAPQTTAQAIAGQSDDEFLKSLGL